MLHSVEHPLGVSDATQSVTPWYQTPWGLMLHDAPRRMYDDCSLTNSCVVIDAY